MKRPKKHYVSILSLVLVLMAVLSAPARAELYGFYPITNNSGLQNTVALQLSVDITDPGGNQALFTFYNDGPAASPYDVPSPIISEITTIYIDDNAGVLSGLASITQSPTGFTDLFREGGTGLPDPPYEIKPQNLPGGAPAGFFANEFLSAQRTTAPGGGINVGEYASLLYSIVVGKSFADVLNAMDLASMRIGLHVQSIGGSTGTSDSFVTPVPGAAILGLLGLGIAGWKLRKFA
jgi:hypothetical protein